MTIYIAIAVIVVILVALYYSIVKKPHGFVEFRTGLVLKMLPEIKGEVDLVKLRKDFSDLALSSLKKLKISPDTISNVSMATRHGNIDARAFVMHEGKEKPLIVFFHGGGWCIGSLDTHHEQCTRIALNSGMSVLSIDYSLAPEYPFPRAVEECVDTVEWILDAKATPFADHSRLILMGDSAGGNLSIVVAMEMIKKGKGSHIFEVVPIYPATDCYSEKSGSYTRYDSGYFLTKQLMTAFEKGYFKNGGDQKDAYASPLLVDDLSEFLDTYLITAEFDPLCDEGEAFAKKLESQGRNVTLKRYDGAIHGFFGRASFGRKGLRAVRELGNYLKNKY